MMIDFDQIFIISIRNHSLPITISKRGTSYNPFNRFTDTGFVWDEEIQPEEQGSTATKFITDESATIISTNNSPDIPFEVSVNPYRGCEHGCVYCYARPTHEYLGYSSGQDFESKILVKRNAAELLRKELASQRWVPRRLQMSGVTDPYQPAERKLKITRSCMEVLAEARNPVTIITKNHLVTRDIDLLTELNKFQSVAVFLSITSLDEKLTAVMEPRTSRPGRRLDALRKLRDAGIPAGIMLAPVIPGLNDHEIPDVLRASADAGALTAGFTLLRLPYSLKELFSEWLGKHYPARKQKILNRILMYRNGVLNRSEFGKRFRGEGPISDQVAEMFRIHALKNGLNVNRIELSTSHFRRPSLNGQMNLWE